MGASTRRQSAALGGREGQMRPAEVAAAFVARINAHDLQGLSELMTDDHAFIDALDNRAAGRAAMRAGWQQYFAAVPDYWIRVEAVFEDGGSVALFGRAGGTYAPGGPKGEAGAWEVPAAWWAQVRGDHVAVWRVYADNLPLRQLMNAGAG
jgi:ketosteroid isomerase-like protein